MGEKLRGAVFMAVLVFGFFYVNSIAGGIFWMLTLVSLFIGEHYVTSIKTRESER
jgi:hypothetical protein